MRILFVMVGSVALAGTGCARDPYESGPSAAEVRTRLAVEFPAYVELQSIDMRAQENVGDNVQPVFKIRFEGEIELREDTFAEADRAQDAIIVVPMRRSGERRRVYGVALAAYKAGAWQMQFQFDADPLVDLGKPRSLFVGGRTVIRGSVEETALRVRPPDATAVQGTGVQAPVAAFNVPRPDGAPCTSSSSCSSGYCYPGPGASGNFCLNRDLNCAYPSARGYSYGETLPFAGANYRCYAPAAGPAQWQLVSSR